MNAQARLIESQIVYYNDLYRKGIPEVSDQVFDSLLETFESFVSKDEYARLRRSLFDAKGKIKHQYVVGSLKKTKAENDSVMKWFAKNDVETIMVVEKLDGMSIVLHYHKGELFKAVTRGDGEYGEDKTEQIKAMEIFSKTSVEFSGQIRAELVLPFTNFIKLNKEGFSYKNPRNAVAGIISNKSINPELLKNCHIIAYQILGSNESKHIQYDSLQTLGFDIPKVRTFNGYISTTVYPHILKDIYEQWSKESNYEIDGLVIHDLKYNDENIKLPIHTIAFKVNDLVGTTTVKGIEWNMSRDKKFKPVVLLEPIELGGATIKRATGNNYQWLIDHKVEIGCIVVIEKAGDIIPRIAQVIPNS